METAQKSELRGRVRDAYSFAADHPRDEHPFPVGRGFAESVGYPAELLNALPSFAVDAFAGVSNVSLFADLKQGATVLDLGCGAGLDSLIAARRVGDAGRVIGVDFSPNMLQRARESAEIAELRNVSFEQADAEQLHLKTASVDVALVNGIFNLNPACESIFRELARVVRKGGEVYAAELILGKPLPPDVEQTDADWFA
jgi:arsenite methyltransferase